MIISRTPLRISFVGGGTDLPSYYQKGYGAVVSAAFCRNIYVTVHKRFDSTIRLSYSKTEIVESVDELQHEIVKACLQMIGLTDNLEISTIGEIPSGTGLGSSSALTVGLLNALYTYIGEPVSAEDLLERACEIEIDTIKSPIGKQDQAAAAFGGLNCFRFNADGSVERKSIDLPMADLKTMQRKLVLFYTGQTRSASKILAEQKQQVDAKVAVLDFMRDQADTLYQLLKTEGFTPQFGEMLNQGWEKKRSLVDEISNTAIDELYASGLKAGATGGKLLGAGGGGFLLFYCDEEKQENLRAALGLRQFPFRIAPEGSRIVYSESYNDFS
jgi:D-glycero-alpha-D-manno-heptose-7-phosphate kinase